MPVESTLIFWDMVSIFSGGIPSHVEILKREENTKLKKH